MNIGDEYHISMLLFRPILRKIIFLNTPLPLMSIIKISCLSTLIFFININYLLSQEAFTLDIVPASIDEMPALHSFAQAFY